MAAMDANAEIAASLTMDEIPVKLRCAACNRLANNAFRMPCCDQSICEDCQASLPEACPVCLHEPVKADDCRPNKALRTTIKVFLKKKVMERESARKKEMLEKAAATPTESIPSKTPAPQASQPSPSAAPEPLAEIFDATHDSQDQNQITRPSKATPDLPTEAQRDIPQMSIESPGAELPRRDSTQTAGDASNGMEKGEDNEKASGQQQPSGQNEQWAAMNDFGQGMNNGNFGFDGTNSFPNMGFNDFNSMMQFLPNGMPNPMMASFPNMMGMPGMGLDPMTMSQAMYGGFGGQGMGMNGMNMGIGFDAGQGAFGGFNGQPAAWNAGQNKYNQNAYGGHAGMSGAADFGANAGYGGYNMPPHQGNFNQMNHHHQYPNNDFHHGHHGQGFQNRGRGRGRGYQFAGRGRGGYNQVSQGNNQTNYEQFHQQVPQQQITRRGSPQYGEKQEQPAQSREEQANTESQQDAKPQDSTDGLTVEEQLNQEFAPGDADDSVETARAASPKVDEAAEPPEQAVAETKTPDRVETKVDIVREEEKPGPIEALTSEEPSKPVVTLVQNESAPRNTMMPPPSAAIPTGPAADHQSLDMAPRGRGGGRGYHGGVPFRAGSQGRGSGYLPNNSIPHVQPTSSVAKPNIPPIEIKGLGVEGAPKAPKALREAQPNNAIKGFSIAGRASATPQVRPSDHASVKSPSNDRSRSPPRHQSSHHRHHRHRSSSPSDENERERRRERHHRHSRKHEDEKSDSKTSRTRDASADSSAKRSSHRSRRDQEKDRDSERSSHRSHRHRERSRDREDEHRSGKNRSPSPEFIINGASRANGAKRNSTSNHHKNKTEESGQTSRKRRSDDEEHHQDHHRDRKRSRRDNEEIIEENANGHRSRTSKREEKESRSNHDRVPRSLENPVEKEQERSTSPPKGPKIDQHALEREARNAERVARENQRRALQQGGSATAGKGVKSNVKGRRMSYKYEDDESFEARTSRVESEREALRFR